MAYTKQILKVQAMESTDPPTYVEATNVSPTAPQFLDQSHLISVQENVQTDQQNNSSQDQQNDLFEEPEILLPQECFVERCDQIITGRQLE